MTSPPASPARQAHQRALSKRFFLAVTLALLFLTINELLGASYFEETSRLISIVIVIISIAVLSSVIFIVKKGQETAMTIFMAILYIAGLYIYFSNESAQLTNPSTAFYLSYILALFEGLVINRMPNIIYRILFCVVFIAARWIVVPLNEDKSTIPLQIIILLLTIYMDYYQQKLSEAGSYDNLEEKKASKYKDLIVNDIPQGVAIMTKDLTKCLFSNEAFNMMIETNPKTAFENCLKKLNIYELHECSNITQSIDDSRSNQTLLDFLKTNKQAISPGKTICNVSYKKTTGQGCSLETIESIFEVKLLTLIWDDQAATGVVLHDITQHNKQLQMKMIANQQKDKFLATVSHELRTPLNGIQGMVDIMKIKTDNEELHHYLKICSNCSHLLLSLVNSILDINLIRANKIKIYPENTELRGFLNEMVELFELQCKQKSIDLKLKVGSTVPENIVTDKNRISQILINLIGNALKFTKEGSITISVDQSKQSKNNLKVSVEDTGIGIKEKDVCQLFQIFGKLETEGAVGNHEGVGLGLSIANSLAKLLNNKEAQGIQVQSKFGKGSTFSFEISKNLSAASALNRGETLCNISTSLLDEGDLHENNMNRYKQAWLSPIKHPHDNYCSQLSFRSQTPQNNKYSKSLFKNIDIRTSNFSYSSTPKRISKDDGDLIKVNKNPYVLIVDDNPLNITVAELFVRREDYQTKTALDGKTAIDMVMSYNNRMEPIRLILMDLQMPIMDGYQTTKALKEMMENKKIKEIPIVALTANDTDADRKACKEAGMCDFLSKPLSQTELARILKKYT